MSDVPEIVERVARAIFDSLGAYVREHVTTGRPVPAKWSRAP